MEVKLLFGCFVLATLCHLGDSCSCLPASIQKKYCKSDFVMKVWVTSTLQSLSGEQGFDDFYNIRILGRPWKFVGDKDVADLKRVYTASNGALCGVELQKGKRYLISGKVSGYKLRIGLCESIVQRTRLPSSTKRLRSRPPNCALISGPKRIMRG
ncbi:metalloproteinase inhibitor 3-like isoform X2 [Ruditapes philippinarum]|uniref:metalloproteinase inhibitor 3-like isoform X2 n=1 Tax=Ruditapes philippinarum TaxID=129788 RepID=UPI00295BFA61|nr:metalloproteinase inhibitor 3-like isoform X2 [Ruditapes philippinarum]